MEILNFVKKRSRTGCLFYNVKNYLKRAKHLLNVPKRPQNLKIIWKKIHEQTKKVFDKEERNFDIEKTKCKLQNDHNLTVSKTQLWRTLHQKGCVYKPNNGNGREK